MTKLKKLKELILNLGGDISGVNSISEALGKLNECDFSGGGYQAGMI